MKKIMLMTLALLFALTIAKADEPSIIASSPKVRKVAMNLNYAKTFSIGVEDEGDYFDYYWYVDGKIQANSWNTFPYIASMPGQHVIKVIVEDEEGLKDDFFWNVTVIEPKLELSPKTVKGLDNLYRTVCQKYSPEGNIKFKNEARTKMTAGDISYEVIATKKYCNITLSKKKENETTSYVFSYTFGDPLKIELVKSICSKEKNGIGQCTVTPLHPDRELNKEKVIKIHEFMMKSERIIRKFADQGLQDLCYYWYTDESEKCKENKGSGNINIGNFKAKGKMEIGGDLLIINEVSTEGTDSGNVKIGVIESGGDINIDGDIKIESTTE